MSAAVPACRPTINSLLPSPAAVQDMDVATGYSCHTPSRSSRLEGAGFPAGDRYAFACAKRSELAGVYQSIIASSHP